MSRRRNRSPSTVPSAAPLPSDTSATTTPPVAEDPTPAAAPAVSETAAPPEDAVVSPPPAPAPAVVPPPTVTTEAPMPTPSLSPTAADLQKLLDEYATLMGRAILTDKALATGAALLLRATRTLVRTPEREVCDVFWKFHKAEHKGLMQPTMALRGVVSLKPAENELVSLVWGAFHNKIAGSWDAGMEETLQKVCHNKPDLVNYLRSRR